MAVRNLLIRGGADFSAMNSGLNNAQQRLTRFQRNVNSIMGKVAAVFATIKIGELVKNGVQDAMSVETSIENLNRTMQNSSKVFQDWIKSQSQAYGMSIQEGYKYGSTYSNLISSFQSDSKEIASSTQELMKATSIISSKTGRTFEDTAERIRSGMLGSTEAIEDLGVYTQVSMLESTEAFAKFANGKSWKQLDFQTQQQIRLAAILEQTYARYGNTLADTTQTRHNQFIASLKNVQLALGQAFLPIYNAILPPLTVFMNALTRAISVITIFTTAIFGKPNIAKQQSKAISSLGSSVGDLGTSSNNTSNALKKASDATKKTGTAAKKAKKEIGGLIGGLDEINNLSVNSTSGTSGTSGSTPSTSTPSVSGLGDIGTIDMGSTLDTSGLESKAEKIAAIFDRIKKVINKNKDAITSIMTGLMVGLGFLMIKNWGQIYQVLSRNFPLLTKIFSKLGKAILKPFTLIKTAIKGLLALNPVTAAITIAIVAIVSAITYLWKTNKDFRDKIIKTWKVIKDALQPWLEGFCILFKTLADILITVLGAAFKLVSKIILKIVETFTGDAMNDFQDMAPTIKKIGKKFLEFAKNLEKCWKNIKNFNLKKWIDKKKQEVKDGLKVITTYFSNLGKDIQKKWDETISIAKDFIINITSTVEDFKDKVVEKWDAAKDWLKDKVIEIGAKVSSLYDEVKNSYNNAKNAIKNWLFNIGVSVGSFFTKVWESYNIAKNNVKGLIFNIAVSVGSFFTKVWESYNIAKNNVKGLIFNIAVSVGSFFTKVYESYNNAKNSIKNWAFNIALKVETSANSVKGVINGIIKQINNSVMGKIKFTVPSWIPAFGGKTWKAPTIPYLAKGGIIDNPTLAMVGEAGKEAVMPLENNTGWITDLAGKISSRMGDTGYNNPTNNQSREVYNGDVIIKLDGNTVFRQSIISILRQLKRQGITI